ncbi:MAG: tRNA (adenosine(37)-N6)-threonylcarbamoyltransferase complex dimerization subunit type 1 TsaB [Clostridia bacterium]|nr:tRNA (adenosine(37)-N6)-threonylcarbamoyltransferase complex dimerization subunit type 1 TsaB [Clostridia bacterium]
MKILAVDTSASPVSAALLSDGALLGEFYLNIKTTHSQTLMPIVSALLSSSGTDIKDIDIFAVNVGPGSFTGVRIGTASVKGMSMPLGKPCAQISTLEAMAYSMPYSDGIVCAVMDARCSQVYNALFRLDGGEIERITEDRALSIEALAEDLGNYEEQIYLTGDGADICYKAFENKLPNIFLPPVNIRYQHAFGTALAAAKMAEEGRLVSSDELMPVYLRLPQAERELKERLAGNK